MLKKSSQKTNFNILTSERKEKKKLLQSYTSCLDSQSVKSVQNLIKRMLLSTILTTPEKNKK